MTNAVNKVTPDLALLYDELLKIHFRIVGGDGVSSISGVLWSLDSTNLTLDSQ